MSEATTKELVITRVFDAPRELVFKAFTDPDQIAQWFGPVGYSVPRDTVEVDLRVGGHQRLTMVPDSDELPPGGPADGVYDEIVEPELLVSHEEFDEEMAKLFGSSRMTRSSGSSSTTRTARLAWSCVRGRTAKTSRTWRDRAGRVRSANSTSSSSADCVTVLM